MCHKSCQTHTPPRILTHSVTSRAFIAGELPGSSPANAVAESANTSASPVSNAAETLQI